MKTFVLLCVVLCLLVSAVYSADVARSGGEAQIAKRSSGSDIEKSRSKRACRSRVICRCWYCYRRGSRWVCHWFYLRGVTCCGWYYKRPHACCHTVCRRYIAKYIIG